MIDKVYFGSIIARNRKMKLWKYIGLMFVMAVASLQGYAQTSGELNRFSNESLTSVNEVRLFPNPTIDYLEVEINNPTIEHANFTVHNIIGNVINVEVVELSDNQYRLKVEGLAPGYYLLAIKDDRNIFKETYKFLKR